MQLELPRIDDLDWQAIVDHGLRSIANASDGAWTHHSPLDAGVTLLEVYAWLAEQQLFAYDHLPPALRQALLALAGITPRAARCATTLLHLCTGHSAATVARGTVFERPGVRPPLRLTATEGITAQPTARLALVIDGRDRSLDLERGASVRPVDGLGPASFEIWWWFTRPPAPLDGRPLSFACELDAPGTPRPDWAPPAEDDRIWTEAPPVVGPMLPLRWTYETRDGFRPFADGALSDGTGGLRRSGVIRFPYPADWAPLDDRAAGPWPFRLRITTRTRAGHVPPRIARLTPNVVVARHIERRGNATVLRRLPLPGISIDLPTEGMPLLTEGLGVELTERDGACHPWRPTAALALAGPADRVFTVDRAVGRITFGDGRTGRQPVVPADGGALEACYALGGGDAGNVSPGLSWRALDGSDLEAINIVPGLGGADPERLDAAERRSTATMHRVERALTAADIEHVALTTPGVALARARALVGHDPARPGVGDTPGVVTVLVVPAAHRRSDAVRTEWVRAPVPDDEALSAIARRMGERRPLGIQLYARPPCYRGVTLAVRVHADPRLRDGIFGALEHAFVRFLDPIVGGETGAGWPFGGRLVPSSLLGIARTAVDNAGVVGGIDLGAGGCDPLTLMPYELPRLDRLTLRIDPRQRPIGGLR